MSATLPESIKRQAQEWMVLLWSGEVTDQQQQQFQHWLQSHPQHAMAWEEVSQFDHMLGGMPNQLSLTTLKTRPSGMSRRALLQWVVASGLTAGLVYQGYRQNWLAVYRADHRTTVGDFKHITLPDQTQLALNSDSAVNIAFDQQVRRVELLRGEVLVRTAAVKDVRPFFVQTPQGQARALGTQYSVRLLDAQTQVSVLQDKVEITNRLGNVVRIHQGERVRFDDQTIHAIEASQTNDFAWSEGRLVATQMPLCELAEQIQRYRRGYIRCDERIADLKVSGVFALHSTDNVLHSLPTILPIQVQFQTPYWVSLSPSKVDSD